MQGSAVRGGLQGAELVGTPGVGGFRFQGSGAERLYRRLGWLEIGTVPKHFVDP
ncbi:MAG: hypothetical protein JWL86_6950 [Rhizobium sp.]|nr:hypothetical protein [Rhizobium sp.]